MGYLTTTDGQTGLPPYFASIFDLAKASLTNGRIEFSLPDGRVFRIETAHPGPAVLLEVRNPDLFARLVREGDLGFCEAYLDGWWSTPDLQGLMDLIHLGNGDLQEAFPAMRLVRLFERLRHWLRSNTRSGARRNIAYHYDLGNDFYRLWLDETMTYSSAIFKTGQESLEAAQRAKYASMVDRMGVGPGDHVLEIGCGWGGFAEYAAAERGLRVTGLTISQAQHDFAVERMRRAGVADQVDIRLQDYRDHDGRYDGIASIEMFEAVGERFWPVYFDTLRERLKPGARATLQIITVEDARFEAYRRSVDFIQKYIFPGGMLPSPGALRREGARAGLMLHDQVDFGESYSQTLRRWHETFNAQWDTISRMGFDERFRRMWNLYLTSCAAMFRAGGCDVTQITFARG
jgi:cyclopropane-fatty-acyl-phospholipid synthase